MYGQEPCRFHATATGKRGASGSRRRVPCHTPMDRNAVACPGCDWRNAIDCPVCDRRMHAEVHDGLRLDVCRDCKGVWFDHVELAALWSLALERTTRRGAGPGLALHCRTRGRRCSGWRRRTRVRARVLARPPDLRGYAAGYAVEAGVEALARAPGAVAGLAASGGEVAASVFETVLEIIGGLFS